MRVVMSTKYQPEQYASRGFEIEILPEDVGQDTPTTPESFALVLDNMMFVARKAVELFLVREGHVTTEEAVTHLRVYKP